MEPVEINAGEYYLRQLRADRLLDDWPALISAFADPLLRALGPDYAVDTLADADAYVRRRAEEWASDRRCSWAVAEPTTGDLLGEVGLADLDLANGTADVTVWVAPARRRTGLASTVVDTAVRFGFGALDLREVACSHAADDAASRAVAQRCGFTPRDSDGDEVRWGRRPSGA
ncbi:GNAT family N-acetyltransferase [Saccharomonospora azurea]